MQSAQWLCGLGFCFLTGSAPSLCVQVAPTLERHRNSPGGLPPMPNLPLRAAPSFCGLGCWRTGNKSCLAHRRATDCELSHTAKDTPADSMGPFASSTFQAVGNPNFRKEKAHFPLGNSGLGRRQPSLNTSPPAQFWALLLKVSLYSPSRPVCLSAPPGEKEDKVSSSMPWSQGRRQTRLPPLPHRFQLATNQVPALCHNEGGEKCRRGLA